MKKIKNLAHATLCSRWKIRALAGVGGLLMGLGCVHAGAAPAGMASIARLMKPYDTHWTTPGGGPSASMPVGNGAIGLNVWTEKNGDIDFYIGKTDSWSNWPGGANYGLMKLGQIKITMTPAPLAARHHFAQDLQLYKGQIRITEGRGAGVVKVRLWVDANHPVIHVQVRSARPISIATHLIDWRVKPGYSGEPDTIVPKLKRRIIWYHRDSRTSIAAVKNLTFGALIASPGCRDKNAETLQSTAPRKTFNISIYPLTATTATAGEWVGMLRRQAHQLSALPLAGALRADHRWWANFWHRSWIFVSGDKAAQSTTGGYVLQRFVSACAGRGAYPIKFNGSIFVVADSWHNNGAGNPPGVTADFRVWGGQYWFQNTRAIYWPMLKAGDFDMMKPLFNMYYHELMFNEPLVRQYYHHGGSYIAETAPFYGGIPDITPQMKCVYTTRYYTPILELSMMMLAYYHYTGDAAFARKTLIPMARLGLEFFDRHFPRDAHGKLLLQPDNSIEEFWSVSDPAPDIAGLHAVLAGLLALPPSLVNGSLRRRWEKMVTELPPLPMGLKDGKKVLLPYTGPQTAPRHNSENPELYAVYPFRLFGLDRPHLKLAEDTFAARKYRMTGDWYEDAIEAAMLGRTGLAMKDVIVNFTDKSARMKFPAFWARVNDYRPCEDDGAVGEEALQEMLLQTAGKKLLLLPAWPANWNVYFKLHAPERTMVVGRVLKGKLVYLKVTPASRRADVVVYKPYVVHE